MTGVTVEIEVLWLPKVAVPETARESTQALLEADKFNINNCRGMCMLDGNHGHT